MQNTITDRQPPDQILTVTHVARMLSRSPRTIRYWAELGILPGFKIGPRQWNFSERDILAFIPSQKPETTNSIGNTGTHGRSGGR